MEERRLVKSGLSSFTIALPKEWIKRNKLGKGSSVYCKEDSGGLILLPKKIKEKKPDTEILLLVDEVSIKSISRDLVANYLKNSGAIKLKGKELMSKLAELKKVIGQLAGLEVIEETGDTLILKDFIDIDEISLKNLIRRSDNILRSMFTDTLICINSSNPPLAEAIRLRDKEVNRLIFLVYKGLNYLAEHPQEASTQEIKPTEFMHLWELNNHLEKIGDEVKRLAIATTELKIGKNEAVQIGSLLKEVKEAHTQIMTSIYKKDIALSDKYASVLKDIQKKCENHIKNSRAVEIRQPIARINYLLSHLKDISRIVRYFGFERVE